MKKIMTQAKKNRGLLTAVLASVVLLLAAFPVHAQYESFFGGESWEYDIDYLMTCYTDEYDPNVFNICCATFSFDFHRDDTVKIGGNTYYYYHQYPDYYDHPSVFLREDTVTGRLYARYGTDETDDEYLLCDLSLSVGDTFFLPDGTAHWNWFDYKMIVDSVGYTYGKKVIYLSLNGTFDFFYSPDAAQYLSAYNISLRFMEGIGPIYGICPNQAVSLEHVFGLLLCMHKDDTLCYMTHETLGCAQFGADIPQYPQSYLQVYPNPVDGQLTLEFVTEEEISGTVMVRDIVGRVCRLFPVNDKKTVLDMSALPQGVYMLTFTDRQNRKVTKKIVKQ